MAKKNKKKPLAKKAKVKAKPAKKKAAKKAKKSAPKKAAKKKSSPKRAKAAPKKKAAVKKSKAPAKKQAAKKNKPAQKSVAKKAAPRKKAPAKVVAKKVVAKKPVQKKAAAPKPKAPKKTVHIESVKIDPHPIESMPAPQHEAGEENKPFVAHSTSLHEGSTAPYFEGVDQNGNMVRSSDFLGKTLVLYFYPKDFTDGCTAQACSLRDEYQYLHNSNYAVVGVSADDVDSHKRFSDEHHLPFPIIADTDMNIIHSYDVWGQKQLAGHIYDGIVRTTFIIDPDGVIKNIVTKVDSANHAKQILDL